ncbi:MAG: hypothetical protein M1814_002359 [Vezdaea aestivalis]|nr:MAG: hypothetical protein M1814_002359 [Vezdaea aestivalis]
MTPTRTSAHLSLRRPQSQCLLRPIPSSSRALSTTPSLQADLIRRPHRPYQFTALVQHSDGSMSFTRTTSPQPLWKAVKDIRNHALWNPSNRRIANVEDDEAGKLRAFRTRFGRGWDAEATEDEARLQAEEKEGNAAKDKEGQNHVHEQEATDSLMDLISPGYAASQTGGVADTAEKGKGKSKSGGKGKKKG